MGRKHHVHSCEPNSTNRAALPRSEWPKRRKDSFSFCYGFGGGGGRSEEHTSELQSLMRISYAVFCLKKKIYKKAEILRSNDTTSQHNITDNKKMNTTNNNRLIT